MRPIDPTPPAPPQAALIEAAQALDRGNTAAARAVLHALPFGLADAASQLVATALWKRLILADESTGTLASSPARSALEALGGIGRANANANLIWDAHHAMPVLEKTLGAADAAAIVAAVAWNRILPGPEPIVLDALELFFRAGATGRCQEAWRRILAGRKDHVPSYWTFVRHRKLLAADRATAERALAALLAETGRDDLAGLFAVYGMQARQEPPAAMCAAAAALSDPRHRQRVLDFIVDMGYAPGDIADVVAGVERIAAGTGAPDDLRAFMQARLANAEGRWSDAVALAGTVGRERAYRARADLLAAHGMARLGEIAGARTRIAAIANDGNALPYLHASAAFLRLTVAQIEAGQPTPELKPAPGFRQTPGRPLAQSLWVGRRLRWIEELAIRSYLDNGWRFQLYVYDDVENVPAGCEVLDANTVIHRRELFREGSGSGIHAGSLGGFSDLFRYRLLYQRGGMWTDTDVINLKRFDPDGRSFVSTEITDAGWTTVNGALLAAPARSPFMARAYERSVEILRGDRMIYTRIGPHLLAELLVEFGPDGMEIMPPKFLSPIYWMSTARLLEPHDKVRDFLAASGAMNLHVYTEMWRTLGLGLDRPPGEDTFLGRLYAERVPGGAREAVA